MADENFSFPPNSGDDDVQLFLRFNCKRFSVLRAQKAKGGGPQHFLSVKLPMPPNMVATSALSFAKDTTIESALRENLGESDGEFFKTGISGVIASLFQGVGQAATLKKGNPFQVQIDMGEMVFNESVSRVFQFNYQLVARNHGEAQEIANIARAFEGYSLPRKSPNLPIFRMEMPPIWTWVAEDKSGKRLSQELWTGQNKPAFLQNVTVDRTSSGGVYAVNTPDGEGDSILPLSTSIALQFVEIEPNIFDPDSREIKSRSQIIVGERSKGGMVE